MSLADTIRNGVATANTLTKDLQALVTHKPWIGQDGVGAEQYGTPVVHNALVDRTRKPLYTNSGKLVMTLATITILEPIVATVPNVGQIRVNPVDPRDLFILDDGTTGPIVKVNGFEDAGAAPAPYLNEVTLGVA